MSTPLIVEHTFAPVNPQLNSQLPLFPDPVTHHKYYPSNSNKKIVYYGSKSLKTYGVSSSRIVLTKGLFDKRYDQVVDCLRDVVKLPTCEREATLRLLRLWAYYGNVYPKASTVCSEPGCSKATFWRAVKYLKHLGLVKTVPRFLVRPHAQISDLFRLDKLVLLIARYLAEHGTKFLEKWLKPYLRMSGQMFWGSMLTGISPGPGCLSGMDT